MDAIVQRLMPGPRLVSIALFVIWVPASALGQQTTHDSQPYHVGTWFYAAWNHAALATWGPQHWLPIYGRADTWGGVRDFAEGKGAFPLHNPLTGGPIEYTGREPLIGFYDLMRQPIVDLEIQMAASEGIEFFALYWYIDAVNGQEQPVSAPTKLFFSSQYRNTMKFALAPIIGADQPKDIISLDTWKLTTVPKLISYMASDAYYRPAGKPMVIDFSWRFHSPQDQKYAINLLRREVARVLGVEPIIISLINSQNTYNDLRFGQKLVEPDGFTCFQPPIQGSPEPYAEGAVPWMKATMAAPNAAPDARLLYIPCGAIGRDPHPWQANNSALSAKWTVGTNPSLWREHLEQIKAFIDSGRVNTMKTVLLYAWNEWGESAEQIEPSKKSGYTFADVVREVFGLNPQISKPAIPR